MGMARGMERNGGPTENLHDKLKGQAQRHDPLRVPREHCPTKCHLCFRKIRDLSATSTTGMDPGYMQTYYICMHHSHS